MIDNNKQLKDEIIDIIVYDNIFKKELENSLYKSSAKLTNKELLLDGDAHIPNVQNWLSDFIKQYGSGFFDNVTLSRYITFSENVKKLDENEKNLVKKLLQLYRNLKFFPDSMKDIPVDDWEIVPIDKFVVKKHSELSGPPKTKGEKEIEKLRQEEGDYAENSLERKMLEEEVEKKEQIENLQSEANKYPQGSLEKKALESEFKELPAGVKRNISSPDVMKEVEILEKEYGISLATLIMRVMVKNIKFVDLVRYFIFEENFNIEKAEKLVEELREKVFKNSLVYLGVEQSVSPEIDEIEIGGREALDEKLNIIEINEEEALTPKKKEAESAVQGSDFFFSPEDEEEVKNLAQALQHTDKREDHKSNLKNQVLNIMNQMNISFSSDDVKARCEKAINTYLRGVRNKIDTRQTLARAVHLGGVGLQEEEIDKIFSISDKVKFSETHDYTLLKHDKKDEYEKEKLKNIGARDAAYDFSKLAEKSKDQKVKLKVDGQDLKVYKTENQKKLVTPEEAVEIRDKTNNNDKAEQVQVKNIEILNSVKKETDKQEDLSPREKVALQPTNEPRIEISPVSVHSEMVGGGDIASVRKMSRQSKINTLYLNMGRESTNIQKPIEDIINIRKNNNQEYLTIEEFSAVMDLNKGLRF